MTFPSLFPESRWWKSLELMALRRPAWHQLPAETISLFCWQPVRQLSIHVAVCVPKNHPANKLWEDISLNGIKCITKTWFLVYSWLYCVILSKSPTCLFSTVILIKEWTYWIRLNPIFSSNDQCSNTKHCFRETQGKRPPLSSPTHTLTIDLYI